MYVMYVCIRPPPTLPGTENKAKFLVKGIGMTAATGLKLPTFTCEVQHAIKDVRAKIF